ncbi:hypothetical protein O6H91_07G083600 [Diphasiastrum complanatum]|uniref:Uncharacterized protein n=2 Tax=Diphasiastrum complanatum TaxID=34168 RepID=A0ACC2D714_DIPCM|nr:hypothetical protein O6H91_07G083600 [Diphasiastrum complanatum]KAJ7550110.1 hypothetical protein O6H91_07G083600 [Diphasiastrum complanatum]
MGKAKTSRKGKKAWRKNISTQDVDEFVEKAAREARSGGPLLDLPDDSLFFVDKSKDERLEPKRNKHRIKVLHCDSILQRNSLIAPFLEPRKRNRKRKLRDVAKPVVKGAQSNILKNPVEERNQAYDIWAKEEPELVSSMKSELKSNMGNAKVSARKFESEIPAVEVDAPGCSYNPTFEDHQEALGMAVAQEMQKVYQKDLQPDPIARYVHGTPLEEEDVFFLEADDLELDGEDDEAVDDISANIRPVKIKKLTTAELNRKARRREAMKLEAARKKHLRLQKDIQRLPEIMDDIEAEHQENETRRIRRDVSRQEKSARLPPRLGKYKFKPEPVQVLLSEEVTGSLRQLKGCYTLAKDRFKSLQQRGILEPRLPSRKKARKSWVEYEPGTKGQKEREMHEATLAERALRKQALAVLPLE